MLYTSPESSFFAAGAERSAQCKMVEYRSSCDRVKYNLAHHFRITFLDLFHFGGNVLRKSDPKINGTRFPHTLCLVVHRLFLIFSSVQPAAGMLSRVGTTREQVTDKIGASGALVKHLRNCRCDNLLHG
jgi:hypothetical protein